METNIPKEFEPEKAVVISEVSFAEVNVLAKRAHYIAVLKNPQHAHSLYTVIIGSDTNFPLEVVFDSDFDETMSVPVRIRESELTMDDNSILSAQALRESEAFRIRVEKEVKEKEREHEAKLAEEKALYLTLKRKYETPATDA